MEECPIEQEAQHLSVMVDTVAAMANEMGGISELTLLAG